MARSVEERLEDPSGEYEHWGGCIYGRVGVGKTSLLRRLKGRGLVIDVRSVEDGTVVLAGCENIKVFRATKWSDIVKVHAYLQAGKHPFEWVAIDTITGVSVLARRHVTNTRDEVLLKPYMLRRQDYGDLGKLMGSMFLEFRALPLNVIFVAQENDSTDDEGTRNVRPDVTPAALKDLLPSLHLVGHYHLAFVDGKPERRMRVTPQEEYPTKSRNVPGRALPPILRRPRLDQIIDYMMGKEGVDKPKAAKDETIGTIDLSS